ncbi:PepSY domain-containing protein [Brachybacterium subflavum]|uniref:PepSY domain-containing protein n=1 Tax=Brachybacterium subflavum TaxID=2585206 RepID=UPI0012664119|nr:PepSY domain-containing protein [Brachybacterium subflavum]
MMTRIHRPAAILATGVLAMAALGACSDSGDDAGEGKAPSTSQQSSASDVGGASDGDGASEGADARGSGGEVNDQPAADADLRDVTFPIDAQAAIDTATQKVGKGTVHAIELDHDSRAGAWQYDVKILSGSDDYKVTIDAVSGNVVHSEHESTNDTEKAIDLSGPMTFDDALDKASQKADGPLRGWKLEWDDGRREYQFDIGPEHETPEVTVDVDSGSTRLDD